MAALNVDPSSLERVAGAYSDLAARMTTIQPQAAAEIQRVIESHGPIGYPTAVGITAALTNADGPLQAKIADFHTYAGRFTEHAQTYTRQDAAAARQLYAIQFQGTPGISSGIGYAQGFNGALPDGGPVVIVWCTATPGGGYICTNLFADDLRVVRYPSPTDRTGAWR